MKIALFLISTLIVICFSQRPLTDADRQRIVSSMNSFRQSTNIFSPLPVPGSMRTITWNTTLENLARAYASKCIWAHSSCGGAGQRACMVGENLYYTGTTGAAPSTTTVIDSAHKGWTDEYKFYTHSTNSCQAGQQCGHYTVIVKDNNDGVGCAIVDCPTMTNISFNGNKVYMVCNYNGQNIVGQRPYTAASGVTPAPTTKAPTTKPTVATTKPVVTQVPTTKPTTKPVVTQAPTTKPTTRAPTTAPSTVSWQPVAANVLTKINAFKVGLGHKTYLVNNNVLKWLLDFTKRQAAAGNFLATEIAPFYTGNSMGGAWCYLSCPAASCNEDYFYNFLITSKLANVQNAGLIYFEAAYADSATGTRYWTVFWHSNQGNALEYATDDDNTLEEDEQ